MTENNYNNSLQPHIQQPAIIGTMRLHINDSYKTNECVIAVEGDDDKKVYSKLYKGECRFVVLQGCLHINSILVALNPTDSNRFIIIKDADFDHVNKNTYFFPNLFLTDHHDLETTIFSYHFIQQLYNKYSAVYNNIDELKIDLENAIQEIEHLAYIKWYNCNLTTKRFCVQARVTNVYDGCSNVPIKDWINHIKALEENIAKTICTEIEIANFKASHTCSNPWLLLNGHDMLLAFMQKIKARCNWNLSKKQLKRYLIDSYTIDDYKKTSMYSNIDIWIHSHQFKIEYIT